MFDDLDQKLTQLKTLTDAAAKSQQAADAAKRIADADTAAVQAQASALRDLINTTFGLR